MELINIKIVQMFPLTSALFVLALGGLVLYKNPRKLVNLLFFLVNISLGVWLFGTFMMFSVKDDLNIIFWDRFIYLGVVFIPTFQYHFSLEFTKTTKPRMIFLVFGYILSLAFLFLSQSELFVKNEVFHYQWGAHTEANVLHHFFVAFFAVYVFGVLFNLFQNFVQTNDKFERNKLLFVFLGFILLDIIGILGFVPAYGISIFPISLIVPVAFCIFLIYAIAKYQILNVEIITAQIFSLAIVTLAFVDIFLSKDTGEIILKIVLFLAIGTLAFFFARSVTQEVKRKEELQVMSNKLAQTNDQLRKLDNAKSEFISIASHQLRTPLTAIKGFISLLLEGSYGKIDLKPQEVLNKVYLSNERLIGLVEDLLNISRIESGRMEYKFDKWNLDKICEEIIDTFVLRAKDRSLYLDYKKPDISLPEVMTDGSKIREVISNIVDNALKYTPRGGVNVKLSQEGANARVTVSDTGIGIPAEELPYLFSKFSRGKDTNRLNTSGTGLGLYVGKSIIESLGGRIWAESEGAGKGSRFIIEVPIEHREE